MRNNINIPAIIIEEDKLDQVSSIIIKRIENDILDRRGIKHEWQNIDDDILEEIRNTWRGIIKDAIVKLK